MMAEIQRSHAGLPLLAGGGRAQAETMFVIDCPAHRSRMLLSERRIRSLRNTDTGVLLDLECYCGHIERIRTGRASR
ncbi:hypothetical protein ACQP2P_26625 [Dactylosporangium sp. CA-139114]|uniref:hypothetical protein n=1 Tax=Dactylosporangium sp. CA-139114 TaxID=3239931 RepID=UPI003D96DD86